MAQPPTPAPVVPEPAPAVAAPVQPAPDPAPAPTTAPTAEQPHYAHPHGEVNGAYESLVEHTGVHPGLGSHPLSSVDQNGVNGDGDMANGSSSVDVLADVAMGEAALGLADFAAGAGSGDVSGGSPGLPPAAGGGGGVPESSPALKRSADEAAYGEQGGMLAESVEEREAKRFKVEEEVRLCPLCPRSLSIPC